MLLYFMEHWWFIFNHSYFILDQFLQRNSSHPSNRPYKIEITWVQLILYLVISATSLPSGRLLKVHAKVSALWTLHESGNVAYLRANDLLFTYLKQIISSEHKYVFEQISLILNISSVRVTTSSRELKQRKCEQSWIISRESTGWGGEEVDPGP